MKSTKPLFAYISSIIMLFVLLFSTFAFAKEINMYDEPKDGAKVVGTVDMTVGVIPIFTPKEGTWMKVGDPRNGNVGWIKSSDVSNVPGSPNSFSFTQRTVTDSKGVPHTYQIIQYGNPINVNNPAIPKNVQQNIQGVVQDIVNGFNTMYQQQQKMMSNMPTPVIMPIVVMPPQNQAAAPATPTKK
jgi:hypothetical protein